MVFVKYSDSILNKKIRHEEWRKIIQVAGLDEFKEFMPSKKAVEPNLTGLKAIFPEIQNLVQRATVLVRLYLDPAQKQCVVAVSQSPASGNTFVWTVKIDDQIDGAWCLRKLASLALAAHEEVSLRLLTQIDEALTWKSATVHPLQALESGVYQRLARKPKEGQNASATLARYFIEDESRPIFLEPGQPPKKPRPVGKPQLASVKMDNLNETYFLARLLVRYEARSPKAIKPEVRIDLSGNLTKLLNNGAGMAWLSKWLGSKIGQIAKAIDALNVPERHVLFYLKGGRALNYFLGTPKEGENDWDTQIVIDPSLPAEDWYQWYRRVHDIVLDALQGSRTEFTDLVEENVASFAEHLKGKAGPDDVEDEEIDENEQRDLALRGALAGVKAELIDIGIERRDSTAGIEEWTRLSVGKGLITSADGVVYPHRQYYVNEYLMLLRDAFRPKAPVADVKKSPRRIKRFGMILKRRDVDADPDGAHAETDAERLAALPKTSAEIDKLKAHEGRQELFRIMMAQFAEAYNFSQDRELAALFDERAATEMANPPALPERLDAELAKYAEERAIASDVGVAHALSQVMQEHWTERDSFFEDNHDFFLTLLREMAGVAMPKLAAAEAQFAVAGSYAASLQAKRLRETPSGLEPIRRVLVKLQCRKGQGEPAKLEEATLNAVRDALTKAAESTGKLTVQQASDKYKSMLVYWREKVKIGDFEYAPLVMKIRGAAQTGDQLPVLSSIEGVPVLDLRYLVADYRKKAAKVDERGSRRTLFSAIAAVSELLSKFDFESDDPE
jgi:hypothetical protein